MDGGRPGAPSAVLPFLSRGDPPDRRRFLELCGLAAARTWLPSLAAAAAACRSQVPGKELVAQVAVVGGGLGGCAAALAACRSGASVVMTEESGWIGGQLTAQAVPPDEHRFIETRGASRSYRALRRGIRDVYRQSWPLKDEARAQEHLNPGGGWVSRLCCEPLASLAALEAQLSPYVESGRLTVLLDARPVSAEVTRDRVLSVRLDSREGSLVLSALVFVDATEDGALLPLTGAEHVTGSEAREETGEPHADDVARPGNVQACTWVMALEHWPGEDYAEDAPEGYARWRDFVPALRPPWPGRLFSWTTTHPRTQEPRELSFSPLPRDEGGLRANLWTYRRVRHAANFDGPRLARDVTIVNWPQNDYLLGDALLGGREHAEGARSLTRALLHWLRTEAPRPDGGVGWPGLRANGAVLGTADGLALRPYVRESRRLRTETILREQDIEPEARRRELQRTGEPLRAREFEDSVGVGLYGEIDLHPTIEGDNYRSLGCLPFQLPLGFLLPVRVENLLPGAKNAGTTHITNGVCRLHPIEWGVGEASGALAAFVVARGTTARAVRATPELVQDFQSELARAGVDLAWS